LDPATGTPHESRTTGPVVPTGAGGPQDPGSAPEPSAAGKPEDIFADLYERNVVSIVLTLGPRASAVGYLQSIALLKLPDENLRPAFVSYGLDRLSRLTLGEALRRGLMANQYELWRRTFFGESNPPPAHPMPATPELPPAGTDESNAPARAGSGGVTPGSDGVVSLPVPANRRPPADGSFAGSKTALSNAERSDDQRVLHSGDTAGATATEQPHSVGTPGDFSPLAPSGDSVKAAIASVVTLIVKPVADMLSAAVSRLLPASVTPAYRKAFTAAVVTLIFAVVYGVIPAVRSSPWSLAGVLFIAVSLMVVWPRTGSGSPGTRGTARESGDGSVVSGMPSTHDSSNRPLLTKGATIKVLTVTALLLLTGTGVWFYWTSTQVPSKDLVGAYLIKSVDPLPVRATVAVTPGTSSSLGLNLTYEARFETTEPLYRRVDTMEYLKLHAAGQLAIIDAARALLSGPDGERLRTAVSGTGILPVSRDAGSGQRTTTGGTPVPPRTDSSGPAAPGSGLPALSSISDITLLTTQTRPGATVTARGQLVAYKRDGTWDFDGEPVRFDRAAFVGERRPTGETVFAIDTPADESRLKAFLADQVSNASRVQAAATELAAERERDRQQHAAAFAELLRTGTVFTGTASGSTTGGVIRIALEITSAGSNHVTALLRNDGGWSDTRLFQGDWLVAPDAGTCTLMLRTGRDDRITGAGPLLEDARDISVTLQVRPDGSASGVPDNWQLRRIDATEVAAVRAGFSRLVVPALAATKAGLVYRGTITSQGRPSNEVLMLRFTAQEPDGTGVDASLQSATVAAWVRPFRGSIIDNTYRAGSTPIRLRSLDADRIAQAPTWSMLFLAPGNNSVALNLRVDGTRLIGQDDHFTYVFEPADPGWAPPAPSTSPVVAGVGDPGPTSTRPATTPAPAGRALPPFPGNVGAYVLSDDGQWVPLPRNNGHIVQSLVEKGNAFFDWIKTGEAKIAGTKAPDSKSVTGQWMFDGTTEVPVVSGEDVVVIYAGPLMISPALLEKYSRLADEPLMEMAPLWTLASGVRSVPLTSPVKGLFGFGPLRVPVTLERPTLAITLLHCTTRLPARHYAVACGGVGYELAVR
jgi:hypothetical protein